MERVPGRVMPGIVRRGRLMLAILLTAFAFDCAWRGGWMAAYEFLPYSPNDGLSLLVGGLLLVAAWGCVLGSWRLAAPLVASQTEGCGFFVPVLLILPLVWGASMWYALR